MATSRRLEAFRVTSLEGLAEEKEIRRGCYGVVYEVRLHGLPCIAKRLHDILVGRGREERVSREQRSVVIGRFREECVLLSDLRHPNVVQFMGVHYGPDYGRDEADISLIMEYMHMDLDQCMKTYPDIPLPYKTSILRDVAYGLAYLHSIPIIHRDLNAGNVLLTESLRAKIADLGVAKLFDKTTPVNDLKRTITVCPGAQHSMPPECLDPSTPKYNNKLDVFSFGHLTIYLVNQEAPDVEDSCLTQADVSNRQIQVGNRRMSLTQMGGPGHPLYSIAVQCLSDTPDQRPTSTDLARRMEELCKKHSLPYSNTLELQIEEMALRVKLACTAKELEQNMRATHSSQMHVGIERVEREVAHKLKEVNASLEEKEKLIVLLQEKLLQKSKENGDLLNVKTLLEEQHVKQMQAMAEYSDSINEKQQKLDTMQQEIWDLKKVDLKKKKSTFRRARARTIAHTAATAHAEWCSQDELDACKRELADERRRGQELQEQLHKLNTEKIQLKRSESNNQMEINRADRFERELELMTAQNRDLQRENAQLKASMQAHALHTAQYRHHQQQQPAGQHEPHHHQMLYDQEQLHRQQRQQLAFSPVKREHRMHGQLPLFLHQQPCPQYPFNQHHQQYHS